MAIPINGQAPAENQLRAFPILRATGDKVQIISDMSADGKIVPDGVVIYTYPPLAQSIFGLPHLIILVLLVFVSGYLLKLGWDMERAHYKNHQVA